jgi:hypothetical protein
VSESLFADARRDAYDRGGCPNGPDEHGDYPCDPKVLFGLREAECQVCGRVAAWPKEATPDTRDTGWAAKELRIAAQQARRPIASLLPKKAAE